LLWEDQLRTEGRTETLEILASKGQPILDLIGSKTIRELKPADFTLALQTLAKPRRTRRKRDEAWGPTSQSMALRTLRSALNWALHQGFIHSHPLQSMKPFAWVKAKVRGEDTYVSQQQYSTLSELMRPAARDLLTFLRGTGCRPSEAFNAARKHYHPADHTIVFPWRAGPPDFVWKCAKKTEKDRIIFLTPTVEDVVARLAKAQPSGPIFRSRDGAPWTRDSIGQVLRRASKRMGLAKPIKCYGFRHTFATDWLLAERSPYYLAELMGTSVHMLERHYGHLLVDKSRLRSALLSAMPDR
jgi:integrase